MSSHADLMNAAGFWRQFVVTFYFEQPGDHVAGTLTDYWTEGPLKDPVPKIRLLTKDGRQFDVVAHQERLKAELVKVAPVKGDALRITYTGEAERAAPGMSKAKLFTVEIRRPGSQSPGGTGSGSSGEVEPENASETGI